MTFRKKTARGIGIALSLTLLSGACAEARPIGAPRTGGPLTSALGGYELQVLVDGVPAPTFFERGGTYVLGELGARYTLRILNHTGRRIEAVASVDGRDVVDGHPADFRNKRGYLVPAFGQVDIDGWRLSRAEVAAFRFSPVADSYAAQTGSAREVGVIGAAIFPERYLPRPRPRPLERPYTDPRASSSPYPERERHPEADDLADKRSPRAGDSSAKSSREAAPAPSAAPGPSGGAPATSDAARGYAESSRRPGLGTEFGEAVGSSVREVTFVRGSASFPTVVLGARYNDRDGLVALGVNVEPDMCAGWACDRDLDLRQAANPFPVVERGYAPPPPCWNGRACR
ncbi:MAG TPA: hypothetical protein VGK52_06720 [Polyangia bacterium]|jgi:hypothetical protein